MRRIWYATGPGSEEVYRYDPATDRWTELAPLPEARHHAPLAAHDGHVYLVAGVANRAFPNQAFLGQFSTTETLFVYDVASDTWREGPPLPGPVGAHAAATTPDGKIHVLGGIGEESVPARDEHLVFDIASQTWATLPPMPSAREHLGAAYLDGVIYAASGRGGGDGVAFEAYHVQTQKWTVLPDVPTVRSGVAVVAFQGQIYVLGGEDFAFEESRDHVERFDPATGTWEEVTPMPTGRHGLGGAALDDGIMAIAGGPQIGFTYSADVEIWRPWPPAQGALSPTRAGTCHPGGNFGRVSRVSWNFGDDPCAFYAAAPTVSGRRVVSGWVCRYRAATSCGICL